jgi:putative ABC transport system permease protein
MRSLRLALRMLAREWRSGELGVLLLALAIAVAALTGVAFLADRISAAVAMQATEVLAADIRLESPQPIGPEDFRQAAAAGLRTAATTRLLSVVFNGDRSQLTDVYAVTPGYPLRGTLRTAASPFARGAATAGIPPPGVIWPDSRLLAALGARVGSRLSVGAATFRVGRVLISRPDEGGTFQSLVPTLLMNSVDLPRTQLIQPGSRIGYSALFAGPASGVAAFERWLGTHRQPGQRLRDIADTSPQIKSAVERARRFLSLASLVAVLLSATAVAMSARRYVARHLDAIALLKTLGATRGFTLRLTALQLLAVALLAAALGCGAGYLTQAWLVYALRGVLADRPLPDAGWAPVGLGFLTAVALLAGFALPPLLQLARVPALRVLRRDVGPPRPLVLLAFGPALAVIVLLIYLSVLDFGLFVRFCAGLAVFLAALGGAGALLVIAAGRARGGAGVAWRYGIANLGRRRTDSIVQIVAFGTGIMALLLLGIIRHDLDGDWRRTLPAELPNFFFINIPPAERNALIGFLREHGARTSRVLPMIRGRLTAIDGRPVESIRFSGRRGQRFATREQNLTWAAHLGADNRVIEGKWWTSAQYGQPLVSIASNFARWLGLRLGDRLTFDIGGESVTVRIASVRKVRWDSFQPNFFIVFAPGLLERMTGTYLTSAYLDPDHARSLVALAHRFPSVSIFDIDQLLASVRSVLDRAVLAVQSVFVFTLLAGLMVLLAAVQSSRDERRFESAMLRTLGAARTTVLKAVLAEFAAIGILAGLVAAGGASVAAWYLTTHVLELPYRFSVPALLIGVGGGALVVMASGWLATRSVVTQPPLTTLRAGGWG